MDGKTHPKVERAELGKTKELYLDFVNPPTPPSPPNIPAYSGTTTGRYYAKKRS